MSGNGATNGHPSTVLGLISRISSALPPGFLMLIIINVIFLALVMHFIDDMQYERTSMAMKVLDSCVTPDKGKAP